MKNLSHFWIFIAFFIITGCSSPQKPIEHPKNTHSSGNSFPLESGPPLFFGITDDATRFSTDQAHIVFHTEEYDRINEKGFLDPGSNPLSTFSIDVDTASYSNMRRFIHDSQLPPKDAIRIEELINYFSYQYPQPEDEHPFSVSTEVSTAPWNPAHRLVHLGIQGEKIPSKFRPHSNLTFLLDVSGSMGSPRKLPLLKRSLRLLVNELNENDRVAIVVYAGAAGLVLPSTPGNEKGTILAALDRLEAGGSTAGGDGIQVAYSSAKEHFLQGGNNRVILATDGDFNVGVSSDAELVRMIEEQRESGIFLTVLGFGTGNYKDSKMEQLADKGNGNYAYIDTIREARKVLVSEMTGTLVTIAKDVKIQVEFNPARVKAYRLLGYENRRLAKEEFNDDTKDAGELGAGHSVTALYEVIPTESSEATQSVDPLKYQRTDLTQTAHETDEIMTVKLRYKAPDSNQSILLARTVNDDAQSIGNTSQDFRFSASVAEFGLLLRNSEFKGAANFDQVLELAKASQGDDSEGYRGEFIQLVKMAQLLTVADK